MSLYALQRVLNLDTAVAGARRLILIALADNMNDDGYAYPKRTTIARKSGIKRLETVTEHLSWLEANGYIERTVNAWAGTFGDIPADRRPNVYRFTAKILHPNGCTESGEPLAVAGCAESGEGGYAESGEPRVDGIRGAEPSLRTVIRSNTPLPPDGGDDDGGMLGPEFAPQPKRRRRKQRGPVAIDPAFEAWWTDYPLKLKKHLARQAWAEHRASGADMSQFVASLANYVDAIEAHNAVSPDDPAPVMHATTFLNGRWEDYQEAAVQNPQWASRGHRGQPATMDWQAAHGVALDAYRASRRAGSPPMTELLAGRPPALVEAALANVQAWKTLDETTAKFAFKDRYEAALAKEPTPTTTGAPQ